MWRDRDRYPEHNYVPDTFWLVIAVLLFAACGLVWLIGQVAAILFGPHHQHLPVRLVDMLGVLLRLLGTWDDPARAWPPRSQPLLPGPVGMYAAAILTFWLPALLYGLLVRLVSPRARRRRRQRGAKWASWWQLRRLIVLGPRRGRIILGRRDRLRDRLLSRLYLAVEQCHSVLAFGPPGSFKTHGLVIPAILEWQGNLVTTSIEPDVLRATCAHRASLGAVWVYDPLGLSGVPGARWTPLPYCQTYADARRVGRMLAEAADIGGHRAEDANYWQLLGAKLLSVLLFAAAGTGRSMADVARWVDVQDGLGRVQSLLVLGGGSDIALATVEALVTEGAERVVLAARKPERLESQAERFRARGAAVQLLEFDAQDTDGHERLVQEAFAGGDLDLVLVAFGTLGPGGAGQRDRLAALDVLATNLLGAVSVILPLARALERQGHGTLTVLSSVAGQRGRAANYVYGASKAGLDTFCQGHGDALAGSGVQVMVVRPGFVVTKMTAGRPKPPLAATSDQVAAAIVDGLRANAHTVWVPARMRLVSSILRHLPRPLFRRLSRSVRRPSRRPAPGW